MAQEGIVKNVDNLAHNPEETSPERSPNDFEENPTPRSAQEIAECEHIRARLIEIAAITGAMATVGAAHHENPNYAAIEDERVRLNERLAELNT